MGWFRVRNSFCRLCWVHWKGKLGVYYFWECTAVSCKFRFPAQESDLRGLNCPACGAGIHAVAESAAFQDAPAGKTNMPLEGMLDNIRSINNVGSIFRAADGAGLNHLHLCGITATPQNRKLAKAALGAEKQVAWSSSRNGVETAVSLIQKGYALWAIEATPAAEPLFEANIQLTKPVVLIVGNERAGVDPGILALCDHVFSLPMQGFKQSLNVSVAFGIAVYYLRFGIAS